MYFVVNINKLCSRLVILIKLFRFAYIAFGIYYVGILVSKTFQKFKDGRTAIHITELHYPQYVYPSITFCSKFKDGQKTALITYFESLLEKANASGTEYFKSVLIQLVLYYSF